MNPVTFDTNSVFFKVLMFSSGRNQFWYKRQDWDTCSLLRHCLFVFLLRLPVSGLLLSIPIFILCVGIGSIGYGIMAEYFGISPTWYFYPAYLLLGVIASAVVICLFGAICWAISGCYELITKPSERITPPSPIGVMYASWKDKVCAKVVIK